MKGQIEKRFDWFSHKGRKNCDGLAHDPKAFGFVSVKPLATHNLMEALCWTDPVWFFCDVCAASFNQTRSGAQDCFRVHTTFVSAH